MLKRPLDHYIYTNILCNTIPLSLSPSSRLVYSLTWFDTSTSGDSALQGRTLVLYSEANARVIPTEAYALLFRATREVSSLIVPRSGLLSLGCTPMESSFGMCKSALESDVRYVMIVRTLEIWSGMSLKDAGTRGEWYVRLMCLLRTLYSILECVACMIWGTHLRLARGRGGRDTPNYLMRLVEIAQMITYMHNERAGYV